MRWLDGIINTMDMGLGGLWSWWSTGTLARCGSVVAKSGTRMRDWTELNWMDLEFQVPMYIALTASDFSSITSHIHKCFCFGPISYFFLELVLHWTPVACWASTNLGVHLSMSYIFAFSYCSWGSQCTNNDMVCHSFLQWTTFCQNSPPWPVRLGWPYMVCFIISLN